MLESATDHYGAEYNAAIRKRLGTPSSAAIYIEASDLAGFQATVEDHEGNWLAFWQVSATR